MTRFPKLASFVTLSSYGEDFHLPTAYTPTAIINCFGEYISNLGLKQLRIAETEKYAHVTYFLNGGKEQPYPGEDRILVPSPKVATYDLKPEMSAFEVTDKLEEAIRSGKYQSIICNYANGDMVGHSGNLAAAIKAIEALDICIGRVVSTMQQCGGEVLITADHGNAEQMIDHETHQAHTAHTLNLVPFLYVGRKARHDRRRRLAGYRAHHARLMGLPQPQEMTGKSLVTCSDHSSAHRSAALCLGLAGMHSAHAGQQEELENLRQRIAALQQEMEKTSDSKSETADALRESERAISNSNRKLAELASSSAKRGKP